MASPLHEGIIHAGSISSYDDDYTIEYYDYEMVDKEVHSQQSKKTSSIVSVETVEDDDDEYTYEEIGMEVVMEEKEDDIDSIVPPPPSPMNQTRLNGTGSASSPTTPKPTAPSMLKPPPTKVPSSTTTRVSPMIVPRHDLKEAPVVSSPSMKRAKAANSFGLSELSKQLRILQAKNESQNVDINRLERQLRILADLKGISVGDLRNALEDACASEAFGELQNRVSKLKFELEAATLAKQAELRKDAAAPHIANLELRVGELEEVEEKSAKEIRHLYEELRRDKSRSTQLESENQQLKGALQDMIHRAQSETARAAEAETNFQKQIQELRELRSKKIQKEADQSRRGPSRRAGDQAQGGARNLPSAVSPEMAAEYERMVQLLTEKDNELRKAQDKLRAEEIQRTETLKEVNHCARQAEIDMKVEADKLALTVKELEDADGQNGLRLAQFKARFSVQDERIVDMGQQLDSLYTAFDLVKEEFDSEDERRAAMLRNLKDADAEIARQNSFKNAYSKSDNNNGFNTNNYEIRRRLEGIPPSPVSRNSSGSGTSAAYGRNSKPPPRYTSTPPGVANRRPITATLAPAPPSTPVNNRSTHDLSQYSNTTNDRSYGNYNTQTPTDYATAQAFHPKPEKTPSTWNLLKNRDQNDRSGGDTNHRQVENELIRGSLIVESNSMIRKWKSKPSRIYLRGSGYQWEIGDKRSFPLQFGVSKVEFHPNHPLSFAVHLDPTSLHAPTIRAATTNEHDYHRWMAALYKATNGEDYIAGEGSDALETLSPTSQTSYPMVTPLNNYGSISGRGSVSSAPRMEEPEEDADLKRVLELSKYET